MGHSSSKEVTNRDSPGIFEALVLDPSTSGTSSELNLNTVLIGNEKVIGEKIGRRKRME